MDKTRPAIDYLREYLRIAPVSIALWRSIEASHVAGVELPPPRLDLGCGFGEFAHVFFDESLEVGIDLSRRSLLQARKGREYEGLVRGDARRLPFRDESFASIVSISVLEHIANVEDAVEEAYRVLRPGGVFAFTAPTPTLTEFLFYPRLFAKARLSFLARSYSALFNRAFGHVSLLTEEEWLALLEGVGFRIQCQRMMMSQRTVTVFDLSLPTIVPSKAGRVWLNRRFGWRPAFLARLWERLLSGYVANDEGEGCNLFVVAMKPGVLASG